MDVFQFRERLINDYESFTRSFTRPQAEDIKAYLQDQYDRGVFWPAPLVQLNPSFVSGGSVEQLVEDRVLHKECAKIFRAGKTSTDLGVTLRLHKHQEEAIRAAQRGESYVLTTGTGSGKSLSYFIPIVDHVLRQREDGDNGHRVRAIVIYPMNALANSQREELTRFLQLGYPSGSQPVTFARYTGQETSEERDQIARTPPDIILTNFMMLELLMTRQDEVDKAIVRAAAGLKFLVLDELHTYRGRQGADVALLVRRVRAALNPDLLCVGTSATMATEGTPEERNAVVAGVTSKLFGTPVPATNIITETLQRVTRGDAANDLSALRAQLSADIPAQAGFDDLRDSPLANWVELKLGLREEAGKWVRAKPRVLTITQSTYDGVLYNVEEIKEMLDGKIDTLHFDEAWLPHATFHDFYGDYHAIGADRPRCKESMVFSTQSTHKLLAGLSQASQILVEDAENNHLDRDVFNEAYLMHTSTSPQYSIIASCDVAAAMMEAPGGTALVEESLREALDFRRAMRKVDEEWGTDWWFKVWGPNDLSEEGLEEREAWMLKANERWHGFGNLAEGFNMLDPIKATIITPGLDVDGSFSDELGIPAAIVTKYLAEHGVIVEKTGLYSFFIMFTIGITKGRWNTMVAALQQFKDDYDKNQPCWKVLPEFVAKHPRYERVGLRDLSTQIHEVYRANDVARLTTEMYLSDMVPAMKPTDAFARMAHRKIDRVLIDELEGRITAVLLTPYPPGIPLLIPGEQFNRKIVNYLKFARDFNERFPGFETDVHGLVKGMVDDKSRYYVDCVAED